MTAYITADHLAQYGIQLDEAAQQELLTLLNDTLVQNIGAVLISLLPDEKLAELVEIQETEPASTGGWLQENIENFVTVVQEQIDLVFQTVASKAALIGAQSYNH